MKTTKKDWIIIFVIFIISLISFFVFLFVSKNKTGNYAEVWYYPEGIIVEVDFEKREVIEIKKQNDAVEFGDYPLIDKEKQTITLLGAPQKGERYEVVIKYDFEKNTMEIITETSPNNICSNMGESNNASLICIPNKIDVRFRIKDGTGFDDEV